MAKSDHMVRIKHATMVRLAYLQGRMLQAREEGRAEYPLGRLDVLTYDTIINILLDREDRHRERKRASAERRAAKRRAKSVYTLTPANAVEQAQSTEQTGV